MGIFKWKAAGAVILILALTGCRTEEKKENVQQSIKVATETITISDEPGVLQYSGTLEPDNKVTIGFAVPGVINNVGIQEGEFVRKGQLLASIDATEYIHAHEIAQATLEQAEDMFTRLNGLYSKGSLPEKDYIDIKTKLAQAKANKAINAKHIKDSKLLSPMDGIVTQKMVEQGSTAAPGMPAFNIVKTDYLYAKVTVPESEVGIIKKGMDATVYIPTLEASFNGKVSIIIPQADPVSKTYDVKIRLINSGQLLPGMLTQTSVQTGKSDQVIHIPASAIIKGEDNVSYVFLVTDKNKALRKRVELGSITGKNSVIIKQGLQQGDRLVVNGQAKLKDGSSVSF
ncbi:efflux RND transporter periplasmic adaptor subunit [Sphingobacterium bambusae]|uniref:Efflux RND transporter periplasmic adaptor subunit n=1 Tax=Sphingobacterium bambusae TaxID=662858 RepID=A0ABW6BJ72_9SPHI|nr:efflux RND transporter periplasmic adaptor subunit [Sphingobacterium bambusae]WPL49442.1 efflux RND transporter periplasmic adaptor subunit [Sphingobacterium bambusae]